MHTSNLTLYNKYYDAAADRDKFKRTYLIGVDWQQEDIFAVGDKGLVNNGYVDIFVWDDSQSDDTYIQPMAFEALADKTGFYTFKQGDIVAKGLVDFDITGTSPYTVKDLLMKHDNVLTLLSIVDLMDTSLSHWELRAE
jgi:hypothetical protein